MSDLLARFRTMSSTPATPLAPTVSASESEKAVEETMTPAAPTTKVLSPALQAALAKLGAGKLQAAATNKAQSTMNALMASKELAKPVEQAAVLMPVTSIPEGIIRNESIEKIEGFPAAQFLTHLGATYQALHADQPGLKGMLEAINQNLRQYEELSYLLNDDQLALYVNGLLHVGKTQIKTTAPKKTTAQLHLDVAKQNIDFTQM